jgi:hypothetical protein
MHQKITVAPVLLVLVIGINAVAKGQVSQHDSLRASGKEVLSVYQRGHSYDIMIVNDKTIGLEVDNKRIDPADFHRYDSIVNAIKADLREDNDRAADERAQEKRDWEQERRDQEQAERDREQAVRDRAQEKLDREQEQRDREQEYRDKEQEKKDRIEEIQNRKQEEKDREQENRDKEQEQRDRVQDQQQAAREREQGQHDREQGMRDKEQGDRDRAQGQLDREQGQRDREQGERDREAAKEERREMRNFIRELVDDKLIPDAQSLNSLILTNTELVVNGTKQPEQILQKIKEKYASWAKAGLSYGDCQAQGTTIHFSGNYSAY